VNFKAGFWISGLSSGFLIQVSKRSDKLKLIKPPIQAKFSSFLLIYQFAKTGCSYIGCLFFNFEYIKTTAMYSIAISQKPGSPM